MDDKPQNKVDTVNKQVTAIKGPEMNWKFMPAGANSENALYKYAVEKGHKEVICKVVMLKTLNGKETSLNIDFDIKNSDVGSYNKSAGRRHRDVPFVYNESSTVKGRTLTLPVRRTADIDFRLIVDVSTTDNVPVDKKYNLKAKGTLYFTSEEISNATSPYKGMGIPKDGKRL